MTEIPGNSTRRLLITGATGGMGRACAISAADEGYDLILADLSLQRLQALADETQTRGVNTSFHLLDVCNSNSIEEFLNGLAQTGGVDAIIHTVGLSPQMAGWQRIIDVDLVGTVDLLEKLRLHLNVSGCAVCIASMSAYLCPPRDDIDRVLLHPLAADFPAQLQALSKSRPELQNSGMAYAYAKRALKNYVADRASAWGTESKRLVSLSPGMIDTEMGRLENDAMESEHFAAMRKRISLGRLGKAQDIAGTALFLVSGKAAYITGCDILVDGGFVAALSSERPTQS